MPKRKAYNRYPDRSSASLAILIASAMQPRRLRGRFRSCSVDLGYSSTEIESFIGDPIIMVALTHWIYPREIRNNIAFP